MDSVANAVDHPASPFAAVGVKSHHFSADSIRRHIEGVEEASIFTFHVAERENLLMHPVKSILRF